MSILNKYTKLNPSLIINKSNIWDFVLCNEKQEENVKEYPSSSFKFMAENFKNNWIYSTNEYKWEGSVFEPIVLHNIGFTGIDNGLINFKKDRISNKDFLKILTESELNIENDTLSLHLVSGNTKNVIYPYKLESEFISLDGGFLQGFFKIEDEKYEMLPSSIENEWMLEFEIRKQDNNIRENTLNYYHPNNKGLFFYMGVRSENKFLPIYGYDLSDFSNRVLVENNNNNCKESSYYQSIQNQNNNFFVDDYFMEQEHVSCEQKEYFEEEYLEEDIIIINENIVDNNNVNINLEHYKELKTDNKFLFFNRTSDGFTSKNWDEDTEIVLTSNTIHHDNNLYLLLNQTSTGYTAKNIDEYYNNKEKIVNISQDISNNAFGLLWKDDGSIGYRYLVSDCDNKNKFIVLEEFSKSGLLNNNIWYDINVKIKRENNFIKLYFYVNKKLKFISKKLPLFEFKPLKELKTRQETVPYNISIGGGTQGLIDSIWIDYEKQFEKILPIEENFAGTFIGDVKKFNFLVK